MKKQLRLLLVSLLLTLARFSPAFAAGTYADIQELFVEWEMNGYPDDVESVYSVDGGGRLCVLLVNDTPEREAEIRAMLSDDSNVSFGSGSYSNNEMKAVQNELVEEYMGGDSPVVGCGIGWTSRNGEVTGFGESGKESRVVVEVLEAQAEEYATLFEERYGGIVVVEPCGERATPAADDAASPKQELNTADHPGQRTIWYFLIAGIMFVLTAAFFGARRPARAAQAVSGQTAARRQEVPGRRQVISAVKESGITPDDDVWRKIKDTVG